MRNYNRNKDNYKVPGNYFNEFENRLQLQLELEKMPDKTGFSVPENYFNQAEEKICQKIQKTKTKIIPFQKWIVVAGSIAAVFIIGLFVFNHTKTVEESDNLISIQEYIENDFVKFNFYELEDVIENKSTNTDIIEYYFLDDEEVKQYIMEEINPRFWPTSMVGN